MLAYRASIVEQDLTSVKDSYYYTGIYNRGLLTHAKSYNLRPELSAHTSFSFSDSIGFFSESFFSVIQ